MPASRRRHPAGLTHPPRSRPRARLALGVARLVAAFAVAAAVATVASARPLEAQESPRPLLRGSIAGTVLDDGGMPLVGAQVQVVGLLGRGSTGTDGTFTLGGVPTGDQLVRVRRLGFRPDSVRVTVEPGAEARVEVRLTVAPQRIDAVVVEAQARPLYSGRLARFWERRDRGVGTFFTAEDIDRRNPQRVTDLLRMVPGVNLVRRGYEHEVYFRGQRCAPLVWIDGMPATAGYLNPDNFSPNSLAGIEVYSGPAQVPAELMWVRGKGSCGVIALWTRLDDPRGRQHKPKVTAADLANLVQSLSLYTADQVDTPAMPYPDAPVAPVYPDSMLRSGVSGRVLVEFVVDSAGEVDMSTFGAVLSTDMLFTNAVRRAVGEARFTPAVLGGRPVRQLVQLPFRFVATQAGTASR